MKIKKNKDDLLNAAKVVLQEEYKERFFVTRIRIGSILLESETTNNYKFY